MSLRLTGKQLKAFQGKTLTHFIEPRSKSKYNNRRFKDEYGWWDSQKERDRWGELLLLEKAGQIQELKRQEEYELLAPSMQNGKRLRPITWRADFTYTQDGRKIVEDSKGFRNRHYLLKKRLMWELLKIEVLET